MNTTRKLVVPSIRPGLESPEIYFDPDPESDAWPDGCWMCGLARGDHYGGATPNDALAAWEASITEVA